MNEIGNATADASATDVSRFLANRGSILVKETKQIGLCKGDHADYVFVETMILSLVKGTNKDTSYGIRLARSDSAGLTDAAAFIDYDELDELMGAIDFICSTATKLLSQARDYTEVTYLTKDSAKIGFYHSKNGQMAFLTLPGGRDSSYFALHRLQELKKLLLDAKLHLTASGAPTHVAHA